MRIGILTVSDRSARGQAEDRSGPLIASTITTHLDVSQVVRQVVQDDQEQIEAILRHWCDEICLDLVLTTGGTGFAPRDVTPEATMAVIDRNAPGLAEAMRAASLQVTPHAMLSRSVAGIRKRSLIVNLPGSPKAVQENLAVILPTLSHAVELLGSGEGQDTFRHARPGEHSRAG
jgi:molybdenum cofactor synthesis domain-containing protein